MSNEETTATDLRSRAVLRVEKKHEFKKHLFVCVVVNGACVAIWAFTGAGFFWPMFLLLIWGIGLVLHAPDVYGRNDISEEEIRQEILRMR